MIQQCFNSVQSQMKDDYTIIILDKDNIKDYLDFPPFVIEKLENNFWRKTITFSDLLRVCLLATYGGIWCDASIFLSSKIPSELCDKDFLPLKDQK